MYEVLDPNPLPEGRSIWIIDMKGQSFTSPEWTHHRKGRNGILEQAAVQQGKYAASLCEGNIISLHAHPQLRVPQRSMKLVCGCARRRWIDRHGK